MPRNDGTEFRRRSVDPHGRTATAACFWYKWGQCTARTTTSARCSPTRGSTPLAGKGEGREKLKKDIRAELDEDALEAFHGTVSLPLVAGDN